MQPGGQTAVQGGDSSASLADVVDTVLDKGVVIDAQAGISVVGIQLVNIDARVVVASVETYLRFAEEVGRLNLADSQGAGLPEVIEGTKATKAVGKAADKAVDKAADKAGEVVDGLLGGGHDDEEGDRTSRREKRGR